MGWLPTGQNLLYLGCCFMVAAPGRTRCSPKPGGKTLDQVQSFKAFLVIESGSQKHLRKGFVGLWVPHVQSLWKPSLRG